MNKYFSLMRYLSEEIDYENATPNELAQIYYKNHKNPEVRQKLASHPQVPKEVLDNMLEFYDDPETMTGIAQSPNASIQQMTKAINHVGHDQGHIIFDNPALQLHLLEDPESLHKHGDTMGLGHIAYSKHLTPNQQRFLYKDPGYETEDPVRNNFRKKIKHINRILARNETTDPEILSDIHKNIEKYVNQPGTVYNAATHVRSALGENPNTPQNVVDKLWGHFLKNGEAPEVLSHHKLSPIQIKQTINLLPKAKGAAKEHIVSNLSGNPNLDSEDIAKLEPIASKLKGKNARYFAMTGLANHPNKK